MRRPWPTGAVVPNKKKLTSNSGTLIEENKVMWINHKKMYSTFYNTVALNSELCET